jgi:ferredoxin--NADP+ reductase
MFKILAKEKLSPTINLFKIEAPAVAEKARPGQFIMLMTDERGERIPLTISDWDTQAGSISVVVSNVGPTTSKLAALNAGDTLPHFVGPLGKPAEIGAFGSVACVAVGYGMATVVPVARELKAAGNRIISIISAPSKDELLMPERLESLSETFIASTSDGSAGREGWVIEPLKALLLKEKLDRVIAVGSLCMMKLVSAAARGVKTMVSLNPIMVDGTGMCGACRVSIKDKTKFACVDGPEFDGHDVDWDLLMARRCSYPVDVASAQSTYRCQFCAQW